MNKLALYAIVALAPLLCAATVASGHFYGRYQDGVYTAPGKLFRMTAPHFLLQTELRVEKLEGSDFSYDADAADWNTFVPELEALYDRIEFLKL